jgi:hypothetical protein
MKFILFSLSFSKRGWISFVSSFECGIKHISKLGVWLVYPEKLYKNAVKNKAELLKKIP